MVHPPTSCCFTLLAQFEIWVGDEMGPPSIETHTLCGRMAAPVSHPALPDEDPDPASDSRAFQLTCPGLIGSVVTLVLPGEVHIS